MAYSSSAAWYLSAWPLKAIIAMGLGVAVFSALAISDQCEEPSALHAVSDCQCGGSHIQLTGHFPFGNRNHRALVLVAVAFAGDASHCGNPGGSRSPRRAYCRAYRVAPGRTRQRRFPSRCSTRLFLLACAAVATIVLRRGWIALALLVAVMGYAYDLRRQRNTAALQIPLKKVGQRALALSALFASLLILGFW